MSIEQPHSTQPALNVDDVIASYVEAVEAGQAPDRAAWLARYPELQAELAAFFQDQDCLDHVFTDAQQAAGATTGPGTHVRYVGDYELLEEIARGGMGVVFKARQLSLGRTVALKMILSGQFASGQEVGRFQREAEAAANLDHPHLVPIYEIGIHEGIHYFSMKLIEGGNLSQHIPRLLQDARASAQLLRTVARAVDHAHQHGLLHRDLKPGNILLDAQAQPHVTDFGLAKRVAGPAGAGATQSGAIVGTPSYMAPEQAAGSKGLSTAADVYALGAILYHLLTGRPPFVGATPLETLLQVVECEPPRPSSLQAGVDRDLETICLKCLHKDPERRYPGAAALADELTRYLNGEPIHARPVGPAERLWRWARRRPWPAALAAALCLSVVVGFGLVTWQWRRAAEESRRAEQGFREADKRFRQAQQAVNDFCKRATDSDAGELPAAQPLRQELLKVGLGYYKRFLKERNADAGLRRDLADAQVHVGLLAGSAGSLTEAAEAYDQALSLYRGLLVDHPDDSALQAALARTYHRLGRLQIATGRPAAGRESYQQALTWSELLEQEFPGSAEWSNHGATVLSDLGAWHRSQGQLPEALGCLGTARARLEESIRGHPDVPELRQTLAITLIRLAGIHDLELLGQRDEAVRLYREASATLAGIPAARRQRLELKLCRQLVWRQLGLAAAYQGHPAQGLAEVEAGHAVLIELARAYPEVSALQSDLADSHRSLGHLYRDFPQLTRQKHPPVDRYRKAETCYQEAQALLVKLVARDASAAEYRNDLAKCHFDLASVYARQRRRAEEQAAYQRAVDHRIQVVSDNPENLVYRSDLAVTLNNLGWCLYEQNRKAEGLTYLLQALEHRRFAFAQAPTVPFYRRTLSQALDSLCNACRAADRLEDAASAVTQRQALWPGDAAALYRCAKDLGRITQMAQAKGDRTNADRFAEQALAYLRQAVAAGYRNGDDLAKQAAFEALRDRPEYAQVVAQLKKKPAPP
jgi:tetratricopeptide (TPR) repeat protein